jgi:glycosyltransferase involved in cell wall biosynthesis
VIDAMVVAIPARNEEELIERCLASLGVAIDEARQRHPGLEVSVVLVADACDDATVALASAFDFVETLQVRLENVGAARAAAIDHALSPRAPLDRTWIACTDADSVVPPNWLVGQLEDAETGAELVVGTVRPIGDELSDAQLSEWNRTHQRGQPNGHVHGANLGVRADRYLEAGGFTPMAEHEDNDLVDRLRARGVTPLPTDRYEVETSGRLVGRTPGGYAGFLRQLASRSVA